MLNFSIALVIFLVTHMIFSRTPLKSIIAARMGMRFYLLAYSALSLALLAWLVVAAQEAPRTQLWPWHHALYWLPNLMMPLAFILLVAGFSCASPLSLAPRAEGFDPDRPCLTAAVTRHPALWGFALWAGSHLVVNGEFPLAAMFAVFLVFALLGMPMIDRRRQRAMGMHHWQHLARSTRVLPLTAPALWSGRWRLTRGDLAGIGGGLCAYVFFFKLHALLFGMMPSPPL